MNSIIRTFDAVVEDVNKSDMSLVARINTSNKDRFNTVIAAKGARWKNWRALGSPVLWEHGKDARRHTDPIANASQIWNNGGPSPTEILAQPRFLKDDFSRQRFEWYRDGVVRGWSVNILPTHDHSGPPTTEELRSRPDWEGVDTIYRDWDLAEFSGTVIPGNSDALTSDRAAKVLEYARSGLLWLPDEVKPAYEAALSRPAPRTMTDSGAGALAVVPRYIRKKGDKFVVYSEAGEELGSHPSEAEAKAQLAAIEAHKHDEEGKRSIQCDGQSWTVYEADGRAIASFPDARDAEACLALMEHPRSFEAFHFELTSEVRAMGNELKRDIQALLDLAIHGRV